MKLTTVLSATASTFAVAAIGYAVYFDYKRRNDPMFRKKLRKQSKQSMKEAKRELKAAAQQETMMIEKAVRDAAEPGALPSGVQEKEAFFMEQVATGEALFAQGAAYHVPAAIAFFKALKVYPAPVELVMIYQKAVPKEVFDLIMKLVTRDAAVNSAGASSQSSGLDQVDDKVGNDKNNKEGESESADQSSPEKKPEVQSQEEQLSRAENNAETSAEKSGNTQSQEAKSEQSSKANTDKEAEKA